MKRARARRLPTSTRPWPIVILAIDPGATSGWCVLVPDGQNRSPRVDAGIAKTTSERELVVYEARRMASDRERPLVIVAETWKIPAAVEGEQRKRRAFGAQTSAGLGASWGRWLAEFERAEIRPSSVIRVDTGTWRSRVIGGSRFRSTDDWKRAAQFRARALFGDQLVLGASRGLEPDAAEAACIALWAERAGEVGLALPATTLRAALARPEDAELLALLEQRRGLAPTTTRPEGR